MNVASRLSMSQIQIRHCFPDTEDVVEGPVMLDKYESESESDYDYDYESDTAASPLPLWANKRFVKCGDATRVCPTPKSAFTPDIHFGA